MQRRVQSRINPCKDHNSRHEDVDCSLNIQLFLRQDFCSCCHKISEQFAVRLTKNRPIMLPFQAVTEHIFI